MRRIPILVIVVLVTFASIGRSEPLQLWLYCATNLQVDQNVERLDALFRRAATAGYSHVLLADSKLARLGDLGDSRQKYDANVQRIKKIADELKLQIVPAVFQIGYSNSLLWHDPNLAEGLPVKDALFAVKAGEARAITDPPVSLEKYSWKDDSVAMQAGVATVRDNPGNARFAYKLALPQFRVYHVSVDIKTNVFSGEPRIQVLNADGRSLQYANLGVKKTQDWTTHHAVFNTLDNHEITLYFGVWGNASGMLQWRNWKIEEAGLVNLIRRDGAPCTVHGYVEGKDYDRVEDPLMGSKPWKGEYSIWHEPPTIHTKLPDGTRLKVSWYHAITIYDGQVGCCLSEPKVMDLLRDEASRVDSAFHPHGFMMSHDEIRVMNWDQSCQNRKLDAGALLAENVRACAQLLDGHDVYVWSDMFDPFHNAHKDYYLVRGDLSGSWEGLDRNVIVMNWNFEKRDQSLKFFADRGHRQIIAGYYDGKPERIRDWLASASKVQGVVGVMYTTWRNQYDDLERFARLCGR